MSKNVNFIECAMRKQSRSFQVIKENCNSLFQKFVETYNEAVQNQSSEEFDKTLDTQWKELKTGLSNNKRKRDEYSGRSLDDWVKEVKKSTEAAIIMPPKKKQKIVKSILYAGPKKIADRNAAVAVYSDGSMYLQTSSLLSKVAASMQTKTKNERQAMIDCGAACELRPGGPIYLLRAYKLPDNITNTLLWKIVNGNNDARVNWEILAGKQQQEFCSSNILIKKSNDILDGKLIALHNVWDATLQKMTPRLPPEVLAFQKAKNAAAFQEIMRKKADPGISQLFKMAKKPLEIKID